MAAYDKNGVTVVGERPRLDCSEGSFRLGQWF